MHSHLPMMLQVIELDAEVSLLEKVELQLFCSKLCPSRRDKILVLRDPAVISYTFGSNVHCL